MNRITRRLTMCVMLGFGGIFIASCTNQDSQQLTEIKDEIKALKNEVAQLRVAVAEMHRATVSPPAPAVAAAPTVVSTVEFDDDPKLGSEEAKVGIVEFSDYQCPFCRRYHEQVFPKLKKTYVDTGKLRYIYRDYPLDFHAEAKSAAIAANCAGINDNYWQFSEALYKNQERLGGALYKELSGKLGLKPGPFEQCLKDNKQAKEVESDIAYAQTLGVTGTPMFFVGRIQDGKLVDAKMISGAQPYEVFAKDIDSLLSK